MGDDCDQTQTYVNAVLKAICPASHSSHFPVRVIRDAMHEWMDSIMTMMMIITINIANISFGISQKTEGPPISQNRIKVKRRRLLVHPIIQSRTTHTRTQ